MHYYLGLDTSNYTTSTAIFCIEDNTIKQSKLLLPVKDGQLGLRQNDAVFYHTKQLPLVINELFGGIKHEINGIGVSVKPRNKDNSYMPCFLCGEGLADSISAIKRIPVYKTSHQTGHIIAALYSADRIGLINRSFLAFHVSGGTTDCLFIEPDAKNLIKITEIGTSLDLKAGQAIDRVGVMIGLKFPCGKELENLASESCIKYHIKPVLKGMDCCLSGVENICERMHKNGETIANTANFCLSYIFSAIRGMANLAVEKYGDLPIVFAGGVMSNKFFRNGIKKEFNAYFAEPEFSCDNAAGTALYAAVKDGKISISKVV